jgi:hypothetical protein
LPRNGDGWNDAADDAGSADAAVTADPDGEACRALSTVVLTSMLDKSTDDKKAKKSELAGLAG